MGLRRQNRIINLTALVLPIVAAIIFYMWLSDARFGSLTGVNFDYYINPVHREFAHKYGVLSPRRVPPSLADYFSLRLPTLQREAPFLRADRHAYDYPSLYSNDFSEVYLPLPWSSGWLIFGAFDATAPTRLSEQRRWLCSHSVFVFYHFLHSPNVTLLIYVRS